MESNNANEPAFPSSNFLPGQDVLRAPPLGLTKREYFAGLAMQAVLSRTDTRATKDKAGELHQAVAEFAIQIADALLAELEKTDGNNAKCPRCGDTIRSAGGCPCADIGSAEFLRRVNAPTVKDYVERVMREAADAERKRVAALEEARRALRFVCHECDVDDVRTRPACWDALARIESLEHGKTNDA